MRIRIVYPHQIYVKHFYLECNKHHQYEQDIFHSVVLLMFKSDGCFTLSAQLSSGKPHLLMMLSSLELITVLLDSGVVQ